MKISKNVLLVVFLVFMKIPSDTRKSHFNNFQRLFSSKVDITSASKVLTVCTKRINASEARLALGSKEDKEAESRIQLALKEMI